MFLTDKEMSIIVDALNFLYSHRDLLNPSVVDYNAIDNVTVKVSAYYQSYYNAIDAVAVKVSEYYQSSNDKGHDIVEHENNDEALSEYNA